MADATLHEYRERWRAVEQIERMEMRSTSPQVRWSQLNALMRLANGLGISPGPDEFQEAIEFERWARLKEAQ